MVKRLSGLQAKIWAAGVISGGGTLDLGTTKAETLYVKYYIASDDPDMLKDLARAIGINARRVHEKKKRPGEYIFGFSGADLDIVMRELWPWLSKGRKRTYKNAVLARNEINAIKG